MVTHGLTYEQTYNINNKRWLKEKMISLFDFRNSDLSKNEFYIHYKHAIKTTMTYTGDRIINEGALSCVTNYSENEKDDKNLMNTIESKDILIQPKNENYLMILTKKLGFALKNRTILSYNFKKKFIKEIIKRVESQGCQKLIMDLEKGNI
eukprot:GAHX01001406.1.p1 GENE.GAHX01001406.1~~GAHX01001406.1.p1  ORF type:complete len:151 (+),score=23.53 GAHX01001406.1:1757-2209(+)